MFIELGLDEVDAAATASVVSLNGARRFLGRGLSSRPRARSVLMLIYQRRAFSVFFVLELVERVARGGLEEEEHCALRCAAVAAAAGRSAQRLRAAARAFGLGAPTGVLSLFHGRAFWQGRFLEALGLASERTP